MISARDITVLADLYGQLVCDIFELRRATSVDAHRLLVLSGIPA